MRRRRALAAVLVIAGAGLLLARLGRGPAGDPRTADRRPEDLPRRIEIVKVLDGDSVVISGGDQLRYIGVDAPERGEPFAEEARSWNRGWVEGRTVRLEYDEETTDRYGRILAYVWVDRGGKEVLVNEELLAAGLGVTFPYYPNDRHRKRLTLAQRGALRARKGIWSIDRPPVDGPLIGSSTRYHRSDCEFVSEIRHPRRFRSRREALEAGLGPCRSCRP